MSVQMQLTHVIDLQAHQQVRQIGTLINQGDSNAHALVLKLMDNEQPAVLDGYRALGGFARADGAIVALAGTIDGNTVTVPLTGACYAVPGYFYVSIRLEGETGRTVFKADGSVDEDSGEYVDETTRTTFDELIEAIIAKYMEENPPQAGITEEVDPTVPAWAKAAKPPTYTAEDVGLGNVANELQYSAANPPPYPVTSVNGMTGDVVIQASGGDGGIAVETDPTVPAWAKAENPPTYTAADVGLGNVANVLQYSAQNQPPYPVTSVNGQTGAVNVEVSADAVGLGNVANELQYSAANPPPYPVTSVNGQTGAVIITVPEDDGDADSLGGVAASVYKEFMTKKSYTVTVSSTFVNTGSITAESIGGILKVGGYLQTKKQHPVGSASTICTISGVKVSGSAYATISDHDNTQKAFNVLLITENNSTRVQIESAATAISASSWLNFTVYGIIA